MCEEVVLMIGEVKVFHRPVVMRCFGLGTCIGLFMKDRITGITGGAHIFLPEKNTMGEGVSAWDSVQLMINRMREKGASIDTLRAKIAGGSSLLHDHYQVGSKNTKEVINSLVSNRVYIAGMDVGGKVSRTVEFDTASETLTVRQLESRITRIF